MKTFNTGAWRPLAGSMRAASHASANDLVTRTLARHGLVSGLPTSDAPRTGTTFSGLLDGTAPQGRQGPGRLDLPPGARFEEDCYTTAAGTRRFRTYVPASGREGIAGLVVMLHGCTQTSEDFAAGTGMNALAESHRIVVVYPQQSRGDNAQSCWNWFNLDDQQRDRGEPAILAGITRAAVARHDVPRERVFVAGLSAGAAMAVILGTAYPDLFHGVGAHSGLPVAAAHDIPSAFAAMAGRGAETATTGPAVRTIVFHGSADMTVHPSNGDRIVRQALDRGAVESFQIEETGTAGGLRFIRSTTFDADGGRAAEHWVIDGMGHAWSGGQSSGSYTDPRGPDASSEMIRFFLAGGRAEQV